MAGINTTKKKAEDTAEKDLDDKLQLEKELIADLIIYFEQLAEDYRVVYGVTGKVITVNESYVEELKSLLKKNYRNITGVFLKNYKKN